jgi:hypothetical protein
MKPFLILLAITPLIANAEIKIVTEHHPNDAATATFKFKNIPSPSRQDAASHASFTIIKGERDENSGPLEVLHDGVLPTEEDQPVQNFFFNAGTPGGRLLVDLGKTIEIKQINTYSWHPTTRAPQIYSLYARDTEASGADSRSDSANLEKTGWKLVANVRAQAANDVGGQYGVSISDSEGPIGKYRYLLFDISRTEAEDPFGNTFYSEIGVVDQNAAAVADAPPDSQSSGPATQVIEMDGFKATIDTTETPDLTEWATHDVAPMVKEWYPKIVRMLPSEGYEAPKTFSIAFRKDKGGVADTSGTRINCGAKWFRGNLKGEAVGAIFHEMVHVVQQYGRARRTNPNATRTPGWLQEGIPDYIRWYIYEPQTHGAEITRRNLSRAKYDASYRITANFLNWVVTTHSRDLIKTLNAAIRQGKYSEELWTQSTGQSVQKLGEEWRQGLELKLAADTSGGPSGTSSTKANELSESEKTQGWELLFNGKDLTGWHNFKREGVKPGWQVKDGALACVDPHNAGDIVTSGKFDSFELQLDYNISEGGNSGIMYHVTDEGGAAWATGPEFQLEDNAKAADPQRCGWLYALYQPPIDPNTGKILDATKPAGQWNHIRLLITEKKCEHEINGVKYFDYVIGSPDFNERVAKSKFGKMPLFARAKSGYIALQGDHGEVSFRNVKVRTVKPD